jgi:hypothetical protein
MEIQRVEPFLDYLSKIHQRTARVIRCIPPEKLEWTYREGKFTLGDQIRHLVTIERYMFVETACGRRGAAANWQTDMIRFWITSQGYACRAWKYSPP